jgi:hypothetical protein
MQQEMHAFNFSGHGNQRFYVALFGLTLGVTINNRWFFLPAIVARFLLQHAVQGWCPPVPVLRRLGFRTQDEIETERNILKARRGDFEKIKDASSVRAIERLQDNELLH